MPFVEGENLKSVRRNFVCWNVKNVDAHALLIRECHWLGVLRLLCYPCVWINFVSHECSPP